MKDFALRVVVALLRAASGLTELFIKRGDTILLISCQDDDPTQDILDLAEALGKRDDVSEVVVTAGRMDRSLGGAFAFIGTYFSMLKKIAAAKTVVLDAYCPAISIPNRKLKREVVQMWHAPEAIKKFSLQVLDTPVGYSGKTAAILNMHQGYDHILCPSDATLPFFEEAFGYPESAFIKYGLPGLDRIGEVRRPDPEEDESNVRKEIRAEIYERYPEFGAGTGKKKPFLIVYAPTFRDGEPVDAEGLARAFERALNEKDSSGRNKYDRFSSLHGGLVLVMKLHPLDAVKGGANLFNEGLQNKVTADKEFSLIDWYATADVIITDYSGVAVEAAAANIASYYYIYDIDRYTERRGLNVDLRDESVGKCAIENADVLAERILEDFGGSMHVNKESDTVDDEVYGIRKEVLYDYEALAGFAGKYIEVPLSGNTERLAEYIAGL